MWVNCQAFWSRTFENSKKNYRLVVSISAYGIVLRKNFTLLKILNPLLLNISTFLKNSLSVTDFWITEFQTWKISELVSGKAWIRKILKIEVKFSEFRKFQKLTSISEITSHFQKPRNFLKALQGRKSESQYPKNWIPRNWIEIFPIPKFQKVLFGFRILNFGKLA